MAPRTRNSHQGSAMFHIGCSPSNLEGYHDPMRVMDRCGCHSSATRSGARGSVEKANAAGAAGWRSGMEMMSIAGMLDTVAIGPTRVPSQGRSLHALVLERGWVPPRHLHRPPRLGAQLLGAAWAL